MDWDTVRKLLDAKKRLVQELDKDGYPLSHTAGKNEEEGGCGVVGFCCTRPVAGRHIYEPSRLMHNRGNGKGGGVAAVGFIPEQLGVSRKVLDSCHMLHVAFLDPGVRAELEKTYLEPHFDIAASSELATVADWRSVPGLEVKPPDVCRYFVRVKDDVLQAFKTDNQLEALSRSEAEDEFINHNSFRLNQAYYASLGEQRAFVLSHGRNIMILKVVGFAEAIVNYYQIQELCAHIWIAHQRFPTKGRVWHPGGAHPFAGLNMALVHNGDFANYHSVTEYLLQRHIQPQFLTDTEVAALMFDLLDRTYRYPLEYTIEALAPTTELDFERLPPEKQDHYRAIQAAHIHGSPDGPWFFIIARNLVAKNRLQLLGITDTAMLRPQVFAYSQGEVQVGLIASEKQAIDATLASLATDDTRICPVADRYWNARGGSHTDGGAFIFNLQPDPAGAYQLTCSDKFGLPVAMPPQTGAFNPQGLNLPPSPDSQIEGFLANNDGPGLSAHIRHNLAGWDFSDLLNACRTIRHGGNNGANTAMAIEALTRLNDRHYPTGNKKRSHVLHLVRRELDALFRELPALAHPPATGAFRLIDFKTRDVLRPPLNGETTLVIDTRGFPPEGRDCDAALLVDAHGLGWQQFICFACAGQRYLGCGLGPETADVGIEVYGSSGDYLGSGIDGLAITVHNNAQDQLGQIVKTGKLVIHGDVGQTFLYGAKGGEIYVRGNAAGRPLINSVGRPRVVINGTCLDFLAESFMAGDPMNGGGFVILNGVTFDDRGEVVPLPEPYPGSNLFSLASGGALYLRDPRQDIVPEQLNGGALVQLTPADWVLMRPYLKENQRLFGITIDDLLTVDGNLQPPERVYRKVVPQAVAVAAADSDTRLEQETVGDLV